jgi:hypothetical protein
MTFIFGAVAGLLASLSKGGKATLFCTIFPKISLSARYNSIGNNSFFMNILHNSFLRWYVYFSNMILQVIKCKVDWYMNTWHMYRYTCIELHVHIHIRTNASIRIHIPFVTIATFERSASINKNVWIIVK